MKYGAFKTMIKYELIPYTKTKRSNASIITIVKAPYEKLKEINLKTLIYDVPNNMFTLNRINNIQTRKK